MLTSYGPLLYGLLVVAHGIMDFQDSYSPVHLLEALLGAGIFILGLFDKKLFAYLVLGLSVVLFIYYGINFALTTEFFPGSLVILSAYIAFECCVKLFRPSGS